MAKGNLILGTARGKLGSVVLSRQGGEQRSRIKVTPRNPKTAKQAVQRMVLATAAKMASALEPIVNHSFEGVAVGAKSVQHFRSLAMNALRQAAALHLNDVASAPLADYAIKGAPIVGNLEGLKISKGSLSAPSYNVGSSVVSIALTSPLSTTTFSTQEDYAAELAKLGLLPGDQLTFVAVLWNLSDKVATIIDTDGREICANFAQQVRFCRVTFVSELPANFTGTLLATGNVINPALIASQEGALPDFYSDDTLDCDFGQPGGYAIQSFALIRSQKIGGEYKYSTADLIPDRDNWDSTNIEAYLSYMDAGYTINVGDNLYLRNAVAAPFA